VGFSWDCIADMCRAWDEGAGFVPRMKNGKPYRC